MRLVEHVWVPMSDGVRLSARIWLPEDVEESPSPAVLEYIPYRKRDFTRERDEPIHAYLAANGYAAIRLDLRGSGESEGVMTDEYTQQELDDGYEAIAWIASQSWCDGNVGMMGKSWGGFNSLQVAAMRPPALKAITAVCATDDRYADDIHYMGGCLLTDKAEWASILLAFNARPPDPAIVGTEWFDMWIARLDALTSPLDPWLEHQTRDDYWKHGSICENYSDITCPVLLIDGWVDAYSNAAMRMLHRLEAPTKAIIGPWGHMYPHDGVPGPAIGFLQELVAWWDHWLKNIPNAVPDWPALRTFALDSQAPASDTVEAAGRWIEIEEWPSPSVDRHVLWLGERKLVRSRSSGNATISPNLVVGSAAGDWGCWALPDEQPGDQRPEDDASVIFDSDPLEGAMTIVGAPKVSLTVTADAPLAMLAARLCDVRPDGSVARITWGVVNLTHPEDHSVVRELEPDVPTRAEITLNDIAYTVPEGHVLRLALSSSYWPLVWPSPTPVGITLELAESNLTIPAIAEPQPLATPFSPALAASGPSITQLGADSIFTRRLETIDGRLVRTVDGTGATGGGLTRFDDIDLTVGYEAHRRYEIGLDDPTSARVSYTHRISFDRDDWTVTIDSDTMLSSTATNFEHEAAVVAKLGHEVVFERRWSRHSPRRGL